MRRIDIDRQYWQGLVLSGGQGRRLNGADKGLIALPPGAAGARNAAAGQTAAGRAVALLLPLCRRVFVSANRNLAQYRALPATVLPDLRPGFAGPLAGLEALAGAGDPAAEYLLLLPCDLPLLDPRVLHALQRGLLARPQCGAVYARGAGREHYLCAAVRGSSLAAAGELLDRGRHAMRDWVAAINGTAVNIDAPLDAGLRNFNSAEDWAALAAAER
jgi:molybdopterin-guanine dinucleotide biosynthesis protein A